MSIPYEVISKFTDAMKSRLVQKEQEGFSGWETARPSDLMRRIKTKANKLSKAKGAERDKHLVDIANLAMFAHRLVSYPDRPEFDNKTNYKSIIREMEGWNWDIMVYEWGVKGNVPAGDSLRKMVINKLKENRQ